jgi:Uma2 family endonuclease
MIAQAVRALPLQHVEATFDPFEDDMGESSLQRFISEHFRPQVESWVAGIHGPTFVGADQYVAWDPYDAHAVVAPDVYVLPGVAPGESFVYWKVWQTGVVPTFALEIVSKRNKKKDYVDAPARYGALGALELVVFDPLYKRHRGGVRFQVYRRLARRGWVRVEASNGDRVRSRVLGAWIRVVGTGKDQRLQLARDPYGDELVPTLAEAKAAVDAQAQTERARAVAAEAEAQAERARAAAAQAQATTAAAEARAERARADEAEATLAKLRAEMAERAGPRARKPAKR